MMLNIPNALTTLRALGVPTFLYLFLWLDQPTAAFFIIVFGGLTDYLDGKVARALNQTTNSEQCLIQSSIVFISQL